VSCAATPGWRLAGHRVKEMAEMASKMGKEEVLVLYGLDASVFLDVEDDMRSGPPRVGKDGRYHLRGKLTIVTGMQLEVLLENLAVVLVACGDRQVVIVTPSPRFWIVLQETRPQGGCRPGRGGQGATVAGTGQVQASSDRATDEAQADQIFKAGQPTQGARCGHQCVWH
jgi:hypothetical protein